MTFSILQWSLIIVSSLVMYAISPWAKSSDDFFKATKSNGKKPNFIMLTSSLIISWIFAKSISVAASLGYDYGLVGGLAYACYYLSFIVAGIVIFRMRSRGKWNSIHQFIHSKFGNNAVRLFSVLIGFRLFNEVWSNTLVVGTFFGERDSAAYISAILIFTGLTLAYVIKGGLRSSLLTDLIQMLLFVGLLVIILVYLFPGLSGKTNQPEFTGTFSFLHGLDFMLVALIQIFSYPFHDPVMTDRAFISDLKTTIKSFIWAGIIGFACIFLFSFVGVYARVNHLEGEPVMMVGKSLGVFLMLIMNFIMITSATSTLDSTFSSFSKLWVIDIFKSKQVTIRKGRMAMIFITIFGTLPVFFGAEIISATTISGTMVIGLAPIFIFWFLKVPKWAFYLSVFTGIFMGIGLTSNWFPEQWFWTEGKYDGLLWANSVGTIICFSLFFASSLFLKNKDSMTHKITKP